MLRGSQLNIVHQNIQVASNKSLELEILCEELKPDVLVLSEFGYNEMNVQFSKIPNYILADCFIRKNIKWGGVGIFIKNDITFERLSIDLSTERHFEIAGVKVFTTDKMSLFIYGLYRSPDSDETIFFEKLEKFFQYVTAKNQTFLLTGDFNINVLDSQDNKTKSFRETLNGFGLKWSVSSPTRVTQTSSTAIDNIVSNIADLPVSIVATAMSDHYAQLATIEGRPPLHFQCTVNYKRDTRPENVILLNKKLQSVNWDCLRGMNCVDTFFESFNNRLNFHLDTFCPQKRSKSHRRCERNTWITKGILVSRENLKNYWRQLQLTNNPNFKLFYNSYKKIYRKVLRAAKSYEVNKTLKNADNFSKQAWGLINKNKSLKQNTQIPQLEVEGRIIRERLEVANAFNAFFANAGETGLPLAPLADHGESGPAGSMFLSDVTEEEVSKTICELKTKKSNDVNGMSTWLLKQCQIGIVGPLTHSVNLSFQAGIFPNSLKVAKVIPIFKKGDSNQPSNYRPISILPVLSKVFERLFMRRILNFFEKFNILSNEQFGFRKGKSTVDAIIRLVEMIVSDMDKHNVTLSVFLDLSKAFDCVEHNILLDRLWHCGVRGLPHRWLKSYLSGRSQQVHVNGVTSHTTTLRYGVPQGSILGPLLFLVYVNDLNSVIPRGRIVQYADDTTLCFSSNKIEQIEIVSFEEINSCIQYFGNKNLKVNPSKSNCMTFGGSTALNTCYPTAMIDDTVIEEVGFTKFLGMLVDDELTWTYHVDSVCKRVSSAIYLIRRLSRHCPTELLLMAYYGLIQCHLSYGIALWGSCSQKNFNRLFVLQKKAIRIIAKLKFRESCRDAFQELGLLTLAGMYILETALYCKFKSNPIQGREVHNYSTRSRHVYRTVQHRLAIMARMPSQAGVSILNRVPEGIRFENCQSKFKSKLRRFLVSNVFYSVDEFMDHTTGEASV